MAPTSRWRKALMPKGLPSPGFSASNPSLKLEALSPPGGNRDVHVTRVSGHPFHRSPLTPELSANGARAGAVIVGDLRDGAGRNILPAPSRVGFVCMICLPVQLLPRRRVACIGLSAGVRNPTVKETLTVAIRSRTQSSAVRPEIPCRPRVLFGKITRSKSAWTQI